MKKNTRHLLKALLSVLALTMLLCMPASAASKKTVATIGKTSYTTMASAIKAVKNGQTIKLQKNVKIKGALNSNKKYTINLNGYTLTGTYAIKDTRIGSTSDAVRVSAGTVTIKNGAVTGFYVNNGATLTISNLKNNPNDPYKICLLYIKKGAKVKINSGSVNSLSIYNYGTLTINKMTVKNYFSLTNESSGKATIKGGTFSGVSYKGIQNSGKLTISGGTFSTDSNTSDEIYNSGKLTISAGTFKNIGLYNSSGDMTISGGKFTCENYFDLLCNVGYYNNYAQLTIKGGTFKASGYNCVIRNDYYGNLKITGGTFKATGNVENVDNKTTGTIKCGSGSKTTITGGTISNKYSNGIYVTSYVDSFKCSGAKITVSSSKMKKICYE